jgi:hypothetical protein
MARRRLKAGNIPFDSTSIFIYMNVIYFNIILLKFNHMAC